MTTQDHGTDAITPDESWEMIQRTIDDARGSLYIAGTATILLLWGVIVAIGFLSQYAIDAHAGGFADDYPWFPGPLWGGLAGLGMLGSAIIGNRAGSAMSSGDAVRRAGIRVFAFWLAVVVAAFLIPAAAGMWNGDNADRIGDIAVGIVALGHILFGIMYRPVIAGVGVGIAAAFYLPELLAGDEALAISGAAMLLVGLLAGLWIRRSGDL